MELTPLVRALIVVPLMVVGFACGDDTDSAATSTTAPTTAQPTTSASMSTVAPRRTVMIFMTGPDSDGSDCLAVTGFEREVEPANPIRSTLDELVAGPTDDEAGSGVSSMFSPATAGAVRSVNLVDGLLIVDFEDFRQLMPTATSSCGSGALLAQLHATVFQFPEVERVRYEIESRCEAFFDDWLPWTCTELDRTSPVP